MNRIQLLFLLLAMKFRGIHIIIFYFFIIQSVTSQDINPFEIKSRLLNNPNDSVQSEVKKDDIPVKQSDEFSLEEEQIVADEGINNETESINPFEINKSKTLVKSSEKVEARPSQAIKSSTESKLQTSESGRFLFWIILFSFLLLATVLSLDRFYIFKLIKSVFNYNLSNSLMRESSGFNLLLQILLFILFILSGATFVYLVQGYFTNLSGLYYYWISLGAVSTIYIIRYFAMKLLHAVFPRLVELNQYNFTIISFNIVLGIALLIPSLFIAYSPKEFMIVALVIGVLLTIIIYFLRSFRGFLISMNYLIHIPFHFFLYLCAFEIIPFLIVYKLIVDFV